ncbi:hypothetical protein [Amycolatopsis pithecellobii]|uniref:Diiron oxygenase n=1 Tax=Amycolatopsis pithecellobii TaxID=664692 RepID=A0A6N7Z8G2_9PSEU|nr:hypothetical protein [Amycolatopsis pithecellobii]MTD57961.1 hypothetical protein [Amycolatopsis pithecellobii]
MTLAERSDVAAQIRGELASITRLAHVNTFHPNAFDWAEATAPAELPFLSEMAFGERGHERQAMAYITKELAQLAEIERHVSAVMTLVLGELQDRPDEINTGHELHHALSCFAAEEIQHANTFYRYVRSLSNVEPRVDAGLFGERLAVFQTDDHPYVKLIALCCSAYVGESVITVFEHRTDALDPMRNRFLTRLLHTHGLDEARHVKIDHVAMKLLYPALDSRQRDRVRTLVSAIEELNRRLAGAFQQATAETLGVDFVTGNPAAVVQLEMTRRFGAQLFAPDGSLRDVDEMVDDELHRLLADFSGQTWVHRGPRAVLALGAAGGAA